MGRKPQPSKPRNVFVGGPIHYAISQDTYDAPLRALITSILSVLEGGGYEVFSAHRAEAFGLDREKFSSHEIAMRDFDWMKRCESFVAVLPAGRDGVLRTDGTHVELGWACALGKPIVAVAPLPLPESYGHLLRGLESIARVVFVDIREVQKCPAVLREVLERQFRQNVSSRKR
ncbi:MAG: nucleoside 2-deoxyribosyltransferase [Acidobacteriota bacterium]